MDQAKKTTQQIMEVEAGEVAGQEIYEESPTRHEFVRFRGNSWGELLKVFAQIKVQIIKQVNDIVFFIELKLYR